MVVRPGAACGGRGGRTDGRSRAFRFRCRPPARPSSGGKGWHLRWQVGYHLGSIFGMKISVSLPQHDIEFIDAYTARTEAESRSAVLHAAIELLRQSELEADYAAAWAEWDEDADARAWDLTAGDGLTDAAR